MAKAKDELCTEKETREKLNNQVKDKNKELKKLEKRVKELRLVFLLFLKFCLLSI